MSSKSKEKPLSLMEVYEQMYYFYMKNIFGKYVPWLVNDWILQAKFSLSDIRKNIGAGVFDNAVQKIPEVFKARFYHQQPFTVQEFDDLYSQRDWLEQWLVYCEHQCPAIEIYKRTVTRIKQAMHAKSAYEALNFGAEDSKKTVIISSLNVSSKPCNHLYKNPKTKFINNNKKSKNTIIIKIKNWFSQKLNHRFVLPKQEFDVIKYQGLFNQQYQRFLEANTYGGFLRQVYLTKQFKIKFFFNNVWKKYHFKNQGDYSLPSLQAIADVIGCSRGLVSKVFKTLINNSYILVNIKPNACARLGDWIWTKTVRMISILKVLWIKIHLEIKRFKGFKTLANKDLKHPNLKVRTNPLGP